MVEIGAAEQETGLSKETLRIWELRYGFPKPERGASGRRDYSEGEIEKLRLLRRLIDQGHRPRNVVPQPIEALQRLLLDFPPSPDNVGQQQSAKREILTRLLAHELGELGAWLETALADYGPRGFILNIARPLCEQVGGAWADQTLHVYEEHFVTETLQSVLRQAIRLCQSPVVGPRVLLATPPDEQHGLALLMVQGLLELDGARCFLLGPQVPIGEIALCVQAKNIEIVAMSFSAYLSKRTVSSFLIELRKILDPRVAIWAGGAGTLGLSLQLDGLKIIGELEEVSMALRPWLRISVGPPSS